eukprot:993157-Rhodomonas_salina.1
MARNWATNYLQSVILLIVFVTTPSKQFADCLTDCVKSLGDEDLDHTKLFACSKSCGDSPGNYIYAWYAIPSTDRAYGSTSTQPS